MILDQYFKEYPFKGSFYTFVINEELPLNQRGEKKVLVLETECDIQESSKTDASGNITASFNVYFPFDKKEGIRIKRGMVFEGYMYGLEVNGTIDGVFPTQLGGCSCHLRDVNV